MVKYYEEQYKITLKALDYPAVIVRRKGTPLYFPPELLEVIPKCVCRENLEIVFPNDYVLKVS